MTTWLPYCGPGSTPQDWLTRWNLDIGLLLALAFVTGAMLVYAKGPGRAAALAGAALLAIAFISPLCALSSGLFAARTVHHVLLVAAAAPLIAWSLPRRIATGPLALATLGQAVIFWAWHAPSAYAAALSSDLIYWLMQLSLLGSATWFWAAVRRASMPAAVAALLTAMVAMGLLGALLTFAPAALYPPHFLTTQAWGWTPLEDQQTAGLIMWAPAAAVYLAAALLRLGRWIGPDASAPKLA